MDSHHNTTLEGIRELRSQLMEALDDLSEVEHRMAKAQYLSQKAGKVIATIRSRAGSETATQTGSTQPQPQMPPETKFLSRPQLAERWGCSTMTVKRMVREGLISQTFLGARTIRFAIKEIERYEGECQG